MTAHNLSTIAVRPPDMDDLDAVVRLVCACDEAITGESDYASELASIRADWETESVDLERDAWVAVAPDGRIVGYEVAYELDQDVAACDGYVHPDFVGIGLGTLLLQLAEARVREASLQRAEDPPVRLRATIYATEERAHRLFAAEGFAPVRHHWQMRITMDGPPPAPEWPEGVTVRPLVPGQDEHAIYQVIESAFADHWGHHDRPFDEWRQLLIDREDFNPSLWQLAFAEGELVGGALCFDRGEIGWLRTLGVLRPWRQRGLGMALLRHVFGMFYDRGRRTVGLGVDAANTTGATRLYERAGMHIQYRYDTYEKELRP